MCCWCWVEPRCSLGAAPADRRPIWSWNSSVFGLVTASPWSDLASPLFAQAEALHGCQEGIRAPLPADGRGRPVTGQDARVVGQGEQVGPDMGQQRALGGAGDIGPADAAGKEGVTGEHDPGGGAVEAHAAGRMPGGIQNRPGELSQASVFARGGAPPPPGRRRC